MCLILFYLNVVTIFLIASILDTLTGSSVRKSFLDYTSPNLCISQVVRTPLALVVDHKGILLSYIYVYLAHSLI